MALVRLAPARARERFVGNTLVLGIGNSLLSDEGAGVHAIRYLETHHPDLPDVVYLDGGTLSFALSASIEDSDNLIVLDAARLDAKPGTVRCFEGDQMDDFVGKGRLSVHEVGLADLMHIARLAGYFPKNRALIGIEPAQIDWGMQLSEPVSRAMSRVAKTTVELVGAWSQVSKRRPEIEEKP